MPASEMAAYIPGLQLAPTGQVLPAAVDCARDIARLSGSVAQAAKKAILVGKSPRSPKGKLRIADNQYVQKLKVHWRAAWQPKEVCTTRRLTFPTSKKERLLSLRNGSQLGCITRLLQLA